MIHARRLTRQPNPDRIEAGMRVSIVARSGFPADSCRCAALISRRFSVVSHGRQDFVTHPGAAAPSAHAEHRCAKLGQVFLDRVGHAAGLGDQDLGALDVNAQDVRELTAAARRRERQHPAVQAGARRY